MTATTARMRVVLAGGVRPPISRQAKSLRHHSLLTGRPRLLGHRRLWRLAPPPPLLLLLHHHHSTHQRQPSAYAWHTGGGGQEL